MAMHVLYDVRTFIHCMSLPFCHFCVNGRERSTVAVGAEALTWLYWCRGVTRPSTLCAGHKPISSRRPPGRTTRGACGCSGAPAGSSITARRPSPSCHAPRTCTAQVCMGRQRSAVQRPARKRAAASGARYTAGSSGMWGRRTATPCDSPGDGDSRPCVAALPAAGRHGGDGGGGPAAVNCG